MYIQLLLLYIVPGKFVTDLPAKRKMNVSEGESVVFDCKVDGKPLPEVNWYDVKIGGRITADFNGSVITISDIRIEDKGNYVCYFHRIDGGTRLREVILDVKEANENTSENDNSEENDNDENYNSDYIMYVLVQSSIVWTVMLLLTDRIIKIINSFPSFSTIRYLSIHVFHTSIYLSM